MIQILKYLWRPPGDRFHCQSALSALCLLAALVLLQTGAMAQSSSSSYALTGGLVGGGWISSSSGYDLVGNVPLMAGGSSASGSYALGGGTITHLAGALTAAYNGPQIQTLTVASRTLTVTYQTGSGEPVTGAFRYRLGGQTTFSSAPMTDNGSGTLTYNLGTNLQTVRGLEYYFTVTQSAVTLPVGSPVDPYIIRTSLTNAQGQRPTAMPEAQYRIIGLPLVASSTNPTTVFVDDLGSADETLWRLGRYNNNTGEVSEFPTVSSVAPGIGYWLIARGGRTYGSAGTSIRPDYTYAGNQYYEVPLDSGWNMIANPFPFAVSFAEMYLDTGGVVVPGHPVALIENAAHYYNGTSYTNATTIPGWEGFFIFANKPDVSALFRYHESGSGSVAPKPFADGLEPDEWVINLKMTCNGLADDGNLAGVRVNAEEQADEYDFSEPPPAPGAPSLAFRLPGDSNRLRTTDFRPPFETGATWNVVFSKGSDRVITATGIADLDDSWEAVLELDNASVLYLEEGQNIALPDEVMSARLIVGNKQFLAGESVTLPGVFALDQNYPNPFNPMTNIHFVVPTPAHVRLEIHNILGQRVKSLVNSDLPMGEYTVTWSGKDDNDNEVASGIYFYRITADSFSYCRKMVLLK